MFDTRLYTRALPMAAGLCLLATTSVAQSNDCRGLLFSTSEDFAMQDSEPYDGNPIISDGDLLAFNASAGVTGICRRNRDLFSSFDVFDVDFGLDAVATFDEKRELFAFSSELDDPQGQFTAGDLLFTDATVIPNAALTVLFQIPHDIGLDAVTFVGEAEIWLEVYPELRGRSREDYLQNPGLLVEILRKFELDILFSTEGTAPQREQPRFLDGDLLSAATGTIFRANGDLLPALPAGVPVRGVDFGLDAYTFGTDEETGAARELLSTEIVGRRELSFTDGDVLRPGPGIETVNFDLIKSLNPASFDLGLDALHLDLGRIACAAPSIQRITNVPVGLIDGAGLATSGGVALRPFGGFVRIQGAIPQEINCPDLANYEFRVELDTGGGFPLIGDPNTLPIPANWLREVDQNPSPWIIDCPLMGPNPADVYAPDPNGWFRVTEYRRFDECGEDPSLAVWNSTGLATNVEAGDPPVIVRFRLVMRQIGAPAATYVGGPVSVRLDNNNYALPTDKSLPLSGDISMTLAVAAGSDAQVTDCDVEGGSTDVILNLLGRMRDQHFWRYTLRWSGGDAVGWKTIVPEETVGGITQPLDADYDGDGTDRVDLTLGGTVPANSTTVLLSEFNLTQAHIAATSGGNPPIECGYGIVLRAYDRTLVGRFGAATNYHGVTTRWREYPLNFCFTPGDS